MEEPENDVVAMLDKLDKMLEQSDKCHGDDSLVQERIQEQHNLIREMGMKFKYSVYKGVVMEARNANLLNENEALKSELTEEKQRANQLKKKVRRLEESAATFAKIKEEYEELTLSLKEGVMSLQHASEPEKPQVKDKKTSCHDLVTSSDKCIQAWIPKRCTNSSSDEEKEDEWREPTVILTQSDLARLDEDMTALKESLKEREKCWVKLERKDRNQRAKINRLDNELVNLREMANNRKQEIENKTIVIKNLEIQVKKEQREIAALRKSLLAKDRLRAASKKSSVKEKLPVPLEGATPSSTQINEGADDASDPQPEQTPPSTPPTDVTVGGKKRKLSSEPRLRQPSGNRAKENVRAASNGKKRTKKTRSSRTRTRPAQAPPSGPHPRRNNFHDGRF